MAIHLPHLIQGLFDRNNARKRDQRIKAIDSAICASIKENALAARARDAQLSPWDFAVKFVSSGSMVGLDEFGWTLEEQTAFSTWSLLKDVLETKTFPHTSLAGFCKQAPPTWRGPSAKPTSIVLARHPDAPDLRLWLGTDGEGLDLKALAVLKQDAEAISAVLDTLTEKGEPKQYDASSDAIDTIETPLEGGRATSVLRRHTWTRPREVSHWIEFAHQLFPSASLQTKLAERQEPFAIYGNYRLGR